LIDQWVQTRWFHDFTASGPEHLRAELDQAAQEATDAAAHLAHYLRTTYAPDAEGTPDAVGEERYRLGARRVMGADVDPAEAYAWGWAEYQQIDAQMRELAEKILPGSSPVECMRHLDENGEVVHGVEEVRQRLQQMMDEAITELDGTHFDIAEPIKK